MLDLGSSSSASSSDTDHHSADDPDTDSSADSIDPSDVGHSSPRTEADAHRSAVDCSRSPRRRVAQQADVWPDASALFQLFLEGMYKCWTTLRDDLAVRACHVVGTPVFPFHRSAGTLPDAAYGVVQAKLFQEPPSHSAAARANLVRLREHARQQGFQWPSLPAADGFTVRPRAQDITGAAFLEPEAVFTFGLLVPGYVIEKVMVHLAVPSNVADALAALQAARDPIQARLYPMLSVVSPMPAQDYGLVLALPGWATAETCVCLDLTWVDGRLFAEVGPATADHAALLQLAGLPASALLDIYLGDSATPIPQGEAFELSNAMCIFFVPQHELPGPYFWLEDVLTTAQEWALDPDLPSGPAGQYMCVITETGNTCVAFDDDTPYGDLATLARLFGVSADSITLQPASPPVQDVAIRGRACAGVYGLVGRSLTLQDADATAEAARGPVLGFIDCRAMLQGWDLLVSPEGAVSFPELQEALTTFEPVHWILYLERATIQAGQLLYGPGAVAYASYVPTPGRLQPSPAPQETEPERADSEAPTEDPPLASPVSSPRDAARSRSPYRSIVLREEPSPRTGRRRLQVVRDTGFLAVFLIFAPDYAPELVTVHLPGPTDFDSVLPAVQSGRPRQQRNWFPWVVAADPQPVLEYAILLAMPGWAAEPYVIFDCSKVNGTIFCGRVGFQMRREALLAHAGFPADAAVEVYVHHNAGPLAADELVQLDTGYCISFLPSSGALLVVCSIDDRLTDPSGWNSAAAVPARIGLWLHVLTDAGPCRLFMSQHRRRFLRTDVARMLGQDPDTFVLQPARPPIRNSFDAGILADNVLVAIDVSSLPDAGAHAEDQVLFFIDARPAAKGITWDFAFQGRVDEATVLQQCQDAVPAGYVVGLSGGRRDALHRLHVGSGDVVLVEFSRRHTSVQQDESPDTDSDDSSDSGDSDIRRPRHEHDSGHFGTSSSTGGATGSAQGIAAPDRHAPARAFVSEMSDDAPVDCQHMRPARNLNGESPVVWEKFRCPQSRAMQARNSRCGFPMRLR